MKKRLFIGLTIALACAPGFVYAQSSLDTAKLNMISQSCSGIQTTLDQLQRRDLVTRTNLGRAYEDQITQIDSFTQRLHANNISSQTLDGPIAEFKNDVNSFRAAYVQYDDRMTTLRQIDCRNQPNDFANSLDQTRISRQNLSDTVANGDASLVAYRQALVGLRETVPEPLGGGAQ